MVTWIKTAPRAAVALGLLAGLAGCGGGGAVTAQSDPAVYYDSFLKPNSTAQQTYLNGDSTTGTSALPNTSFKGMPTSGKATYNGFTVLYANEDGAVASEPALGMVGTTKLNADFSTQTMTGSATNFVGTGVKYDSATSHYQFTKKPVYYAGTLTMNDGCIGNASGCPNVTRPNQFSGTMQGSLKGEGNTVQTTASILGDFRGTPVKGVYATATSGPVSINGTAVSGSMTITGEP